GSSARLRPPSSTARWPLDSVRRPARLDREDVAPEARRQTIRPADRACRASAGPDNGEWPPAAPTLRRTTRSDRDSPRLPAKSAAGGFDRFLPRQPLSIQNRLGAGDSPRRTAAVHQAITSQF